MDNNFSALIAMQDESDISGGFLYILKSKVLYDFILKDSILDHDGSVSIPLTNRVVVLEDEYDLESKAIAVSELNDESLVEEVFEIDGMAIGDAYEEILKHLSIDDELDVNYSDEAFGKLMGDVIEAYNIEVERPIYVNLLGY